MLKTIKCTFVTNGLKLKPESTLETQNQFHHSPTKTKSITSKYFLFPNKFYFSSSILTLKNIFFVQLFLVDKTT